jgi:PKD repeat protein
MTLRVLRQLQACWSRLKTWRRTGGRAVRPRLRMEELESRLTPSTLTVLAEADARVERANPGTRYGTSSELVSDRSPGREAFIRFSVGGVSGAVQSAKVRAYVTGGSSNGPAIYAAGSDWSETGITWNNRPPRVGGPLEDKGAVPTGWQEFDVTGSISGNGTYSFVLAGTSSDGMYMYSRERAGFAPQLVLTMADAPTPLGADAGPDRVAEQGKSIPFAGVGSGGTGPLTYFWDFGDAQTASGTSSPTHAYANSGVYTVRLTVADATGASVTDTAVVTVNGAVPPSGVGQNWSSPRQLGTLDTAFVNESSGMAVSRAYPNRVYHVNDSGDGGYFYISDYQGRNIQRVRVSGFNPVDAEGMAYGSYGGKNYLIIGDIGDNGKSRSSITLVVVEERASFGASVNAAFKITVKYPDGAHNAEALALHPNGDLYILTKENPSRVYRLTAAQWQSTSGQTQTLQFVGQFGLAGQTGSSNITSLDISPDGNRLLILTYSGALELEARLNNGVLDFSQYTTNGGPAYKVIRLTKLPQQESISYLPNGRDFLYTSESLGDSVPILEVERLE